MKLKNGLIGLLKITIFALLFYIVFFLVYKYENSQQFDFLDSTGAVLSGNWQFTGTSKQFIKEAIESIKGTGDGKHFAASDDEKEYKRKFQEICINNILICVKVKFDGEYDYEEKYMYMSSIIFVTSFIDDNSVSDTKIVKSMSNINLNKSGGERRGYATKDTIEVNIDLLSSYDEFLEIVSHELGHIYDLGVLHGSSIKKDTYYTEFGKKVFSTDDPSISFYRNSWSSEYVRTSISKKEDFCSKYGMTDPFEDFSECLNLYLNHNALFKYLAKKNSTLKNKYNFIAKYFDGKYLYSTTSDLQFVKDNDSWRPWDTTNF